MNVEIKAKWLAALRSGDYHQANYCLTNRGEAFCCLGVLNDISNLGVWSRWDTYCSHAEVAEATAHEEQHYCFGEESFAHEEVVKWAGLPTENPVLTVSKQCAEDYHLAGKRDPDGRLQVAITDLNDIGMPFSEIADLIEEQL